MQRHLVDILLHSLAAAIMAVIALASPLGIIFVIGFCWWLRELAQQNRSDVRAAVASMPGWSLGKQLEWVAPAAVAAAVVMGWPVVSPFVKGFFHV